MHPSAERECSIPESTAKGNRGYADIVDPSLRQIFEIKPDNPAGVRQAAGEAWLYVEAATEFCGGVWKLGTNYFEHAIYSDGERQLWARLADPGAIVYSWRERKRSEALELVLLLLLAAALAAKKVAQNAGSKAGGPITAFIGLVAAAAVLVLGEREAKAGAQRTNDDPLVALAEVLTDTGRPMPPEIKALIDSDPQLRELVRLEMERRRRAGGGQAAQAQQAAADASQDKGGEGRGRAPTKDATGSVAENPKTGSAPAVLPPVAAAAGSSGTTSGKPSVDPKPVPSDQKATGLSPAIPTRPAQAQPPSSAAANSYLSSLQKMMVCQGIGSPVTRVPI